MKVLIFLETIERSIVTEQNATIVTEQNQILKKTCIKQGVTALWFDFDCNQPWVRSLRRTGTLVKKWFNKHNNVYTHELYLANKEA